eukprot:3708271-Amphidinium_carterae.2
MGGRHCVAVRSVVAALILLASFLAQAVQVWHFELMNGTQPFLIKRLLPLPSHHPSVLSARPGVQTARS